MRQTNKSLSHTLDKDKSRAFWGGNAALSGFLAFFFGFTVILSLLKQVSEVGVKLHITKVDATRSNYTACRGRAIAVIRSQVVF